MTAETAIEEFPIGPRPYAVTGGRTHASFHLAVELLVSQVAPATPEGFPAPQLPAHLSPEHGTVMLLCQNPVSVAEIAARCHQPLGVARILISDLIQIGLVQAHSLPSGADGQPDQRLLERVLHGLRSL
ncbi:DUF742 domain-containing protein [Streptomyces erythrochromogenes]|uniref:DUF742 domain-containing protein n=1 Tax=Streptomyces erythrochromogenes TaxID=285574 RepID=UPI00344AA943